MTFRAGQSTIASILAVLAFSSVPVRAQETVYPSADGTLVDSGDLDGIVDEADWAFDQSGYDGIVTLTTELEGNHLERRVVWEYNLDGVTATPPVAASLVFTIRPPCVWPRPDADVRVYAYPADLLEQDTDYAQQPAELQGSAIVSVVFPCEDNSVDYSLNVSAVVDDALGDGTRKVAFRFQIDPDTPNITSQAFIDALDDDPQSKPYLVIGPAVSGDCDIDGDVDAQDFEVFATCLSGVGVPAAPGGCMRAQFECADLDKDLDVDLMDFAFFQTLFQGSTP